MYLTKEEEQILNGEHGFFLSKAMKLLVAIGDLYNAEKFVQIRRSQVAGVSYKTAGDATLELLEALVKENTKAKTYATQNPAGMDLVKWKEMGIPESFAEKQLKICKAYEEIGIKSTCTCTPYFSFNRPRFGEIVGFSESSAIAFVNSVIGARTNRYGGLEALSAALVGRVPLIGYLLKENRMGNVLAKIEFKPKNESDYAALGYFIGKELRVDEIPIYIGLPNPSIDELKLLGAASAASGSVALFHVLGITPEIKRIKEQVWRRNIDYEISVTEEDIKSVYDELSTNERPDLIAIGCPHCSLSELKEIADSVSGKKKAPETEFWVFTSPDVFKKAEKLGYTQLISIFGGKVFRQTCMVVAPIEEMNIKCIYTNSAKAAFYIPRMTSGKCKARMMPLARCIELCSL
jgi:predicted aconitase